MSDKYKFQEMLLSILEVAKVQLNALTIEEIKSFFGDMELSDSQYEHIFAYLSANQIKIDGYTPKANNEYVTLPKETKEDSIKEEAEEKDFFTEKVSAGNKKDSLYLKMYLEDISAVDALREEEENRIIGDIKQGESFGKDRMIEGKLPLVVKIAEEYKNSTMMIEDIIGEGNMGLINGINHLYELLQGENVNDFLAGYIREGIDTAIREYTGSVNLESRVIERANYVKESANYLKEDLGRDATITELAEYTKLTIEEIKDVLNLSGDAIKTETHHH